MRRLIFVIHVSVDGCCDHTKITPDEQVGEYFTQLTREAGVQVFGRKTYELMVPYWPDALTDPTSNKGDIEFAQAFVALEKVVFSRTLADVADKNTRVVRGDLAGEIRRLKQEPGKPILVGGVDIPSQLVQLGLVDEFQICVSPVVAGAGRRLFDGLNLPERLKLKLADSKAFPTGAVLLRYSKA